MRLLAIPLIAMVINFNCSNESIADLEDLTTTSSLAAHSSDKMVTVPFKAEYTGTYKVFPAEFDTEKCPGLGEVTVDGVGQATHLGNSKVHFNFCVDISDLSYFDTYAYLEAANGDMIYIDVSGNVIPGRTEDHPDYVVSYWRDPFTILGGTGRFEGASGGGYSDDYNSSEDPYSHHNWEGTITMKKGN